MPRLSWLRSAWDDRRVLFARRDEALLVPEVCLVGEGVRALPAAWRDEPHDCEGNDVGDADLACAVPAHEVQHDRRHEQQRRREVQRPALRAELPGPRHGLDARKISSSSIVVRTLKFRPVVGGLLPPPPDTRTHTHCEGKRRQAEGSSAETKRWRRRAQ